MTKHTFIQNLFDTLQSTEYVLLKCTVPSLEQLDDHSDLDILLPDGCTPELVDFFESHPLVDFVRWETWADRRAAFVFFRGGQFLQVDFLSHLARKSVVYMPTRQILANKKRTAKGIITYSNRCLLEHAALFSLLNRGNLSAKYLDFYATLPESEQEELTEFFNFKFKIDLHSLLQLALFDPAVRRAVVKYVQNLPENSFFQCQKRRAAWLLDVVRGWWRPKGMVITFSGVDGAGKSTVLAAARKQLEFIYRKNVVVLRHRPGLLPILSAWKHGKTNAESRAAATLPHSGSNQSTVSSLLRFGYYFLDYLFGQAWVWARYTSRGHVVLYDRYYFDFMADSRRSNLAGVPSWLTQFCYHFLRKPDLNIFLWATPETILSRKKELPSDTIVGLTTRYRTLFDRFAINHPNEYVPLENVNFEHTMRAFDEKYRLLERVLAA
jgi:thymidylate kinase